MIQTKRYTIDGKQNIKFALFADIHFCTEYKRKILDKIYCNLEKEKPDYILIPGDIIDDVNVLDDVEARNYFYNWFLKLSDLEIPIFIALGGHDLLNRDGRHVNKRYDYREKYYQRLASISNVYVYSESVKKPISNFYEDEKVCISAYVPSFEYYYGTYCEDKSIKKKELEQLTCLTNSNKVNILLCHTPEYLLDEDIISMKIFQEIDIIVSGHMHNGLIPPFLDWKGNKGLIAPIKYWFPKYSRGHVEKEMMNHSLHLFITGGVIKFSRMTPVICRMCNIFYPESIDYISVKKYSLK